MKIITLCSSLAVVVYIVGAIQLGEHAGLRKEVGLLRLERLGHVARRCFGTIWHSGVPGVPDIVTPATRTTAILLVDVDNDEHGCHVLQLAGYLVFWGPMKNL